MILKRGNMWDSKADLVLVTTNASVRSDGALVMGRGAAYEMTQRYRGIAHQFGALVKAWSERSAKPYGAIVHPCTHTPELGIFQVKRHWRDKADPELIRNSVGCLVGAVRCFDLVAINFPGIGNGQLRRDDVLPLIEGLPDNVEVWEYA